MSALFQLNTTTIWLEILIKKNVSSEKIIKYYLELRLLFLVHFACTDDDSNVTHVIDKDLLMMLLQFNVDEIFECTLVVCNFNKNLQKSNFSI